MAEKEVQIVELSKQLKGKEVAEKMSQVDEFLNKKEFSVFSAEEKQEFKDKSNDISMEDLENMTYSAFGKKVKDKINFSNNTDGSTNFSLMYVDITNRQTQTSDAKDVYAEIREKNNNK